MWAIPSDISRPRSCSAIEALTLSLALFAAVRVTPNLLKEYGAGEGVRTLDVHLGKVALYH